MGTHWNTTTQWSRTEIDSRTKGKAAETIEIYKGSGSWPDQA